MPTTAKLNKIDELVQKLSNEQNEWMSLAIAIDLSDEILKVMLPDNADWRQKLSIDVQNTGSLPTPLSLDTFKNQKQVKWFKEHQNPLLLGVRLNCFLQKIVQWKVISFGLVNLQQNKE